MVEYAITFECGFFSLIIKGNHKCQKMLKGIAKKIFQSHFSDIVRTPTPEDECANTTRWHSCVGNDHLYDY